MFNFVEKKDKPKLFDKDSKCPLCEAGDKSVSSKSQYINYQIQMNFADAQRRAILLMVKEFNESELKSTILIFQDELLFNIADGEKEQVVSLLEKLNFCCAEGII